MTIALLPPFKDPAHSLAFVKRVALFMPRRPEERSPYPAQSHSPARVLFAELRRMHSSAFCLPASNSDHAKSFVQGHDKCGAVTPVPTPSELQPWFRCNFDLYRHIIPTFTSHCILRVFRCSMTDGRHKMKFDSLARLRRRLAVIASISVAQCGR
jgi:hypothetical protein